MHKEVLHVRKEVLPMRKEVLPAWKTVMPLQLGPWGRQGGLPFLHGGSPAVPSMGALA